VQGRLDDAQRSLVTAILAPYPDVAAAWVFGSFARGEARPNSDLDIALLLAPHAPNRVDRGRLLGDVASRLEAVAPGRAIDVVVIQDQGPILQHRILKEGILVHDADRAHRIDFECTAYGRYFDFRPTWEIARSHALSGFMHWLEAR
jgi:hypothetical protein